jgi:hypothetical protein
MTPTERTEGHDPNQPPAFELSVWPTEDEAVVFQRQADGRFRLSLIGRIDIIFPAPNSLKSPVQADVAQSGTQIPETTVEARTAPMSSHTEQHSSVEGTSQEAGDKTNEIYVFTGTVRSKVSYWERSNGKQVAHFVMNVTPKEDTPDDRQFRTFGDLAAWAKETMNKGKMNTKVQAFGKKTWRDKQGKPVTGYYAFVIDGVSNKSLAKQKREKSQ